MSATPDSTLANPEQLIADLQRQLDACRAELAEARAQQTATAEVLQVINSSPGDLAPVFEALLDKALALCGANFGFIRTYDGESFHLGAMRGVPFEHSELLKQPRHPPFTGTALERLVAGELVVEIADIADQPGYMPFAQALVAAGVVRTMVWVALRKEGTLLGFISVFHTEIQPFTDKQIALLQNFAAQAVIAMENARLLTETREALEQQTATAEILRVISGSPTDLQPTFNAIAANATTLSGAAAGMVFRYDGSLIHFAANYGLPAEALRATQRSFPCPPGRQSTTTRAIQTRDVVHVADVATDPEYALPAIVQSGWHTALAVPILQDGNPVGAITVSRREVAPFSQAQIDLLKTFADQAVIAIENVRLFNETREALEQQTATAEVLQVINSSPGDLAPVFDGMLEKAMRLCEAPYGALRRFDGEFFRAIAVRDASGAAADTLGYPISPDPGSASMRLVLGEAVVHISDVVDTEEYRSGVASRLKLVELTGARTALWVALRKDNVLLGDLVFYRREVRPFTDKQIALLQNFAAQAVIAIENARLLTETREALEQQTATAEVLQVINSSPGDLAPVFDAILEKAHALCGAEIGSLTTYDGEENRAVATRGLAASLADRLRQGFRPGPAHPIRKLLSGARIVQVPDVSESADPIARASFELAGIRTSLYVPLRKDDRLLGQIVASRLD